MLKKIGISVLLAFAMLVSTFNGPAAVSAAAPCTTIAECRELQRTMRDNIVEIIEEEEELSEGITEIQAEISDLRNEVAALAI